MFSHAHQSSFKVRTLLFLSQCPSSIFYLALCRLHSAFYTSHSTLPTLLFPLYSSHSALQLALHLPIFFYLPPCTLHSATCTLQLALYASSFTSTSSSLSRYLQLFHLSHVLCPALAQPTLDYRTIITFFYQYSSSSATFILHQHPSLPITTLPHQYPSFFINILSPHHYSSSSLLFIITTLLHHYPSSLLSIITFIHHHLPSSPSSIIYHQPYLPLPTSSYFIMAYHFTKSYSS